MRGFDSDNNGGLSVTEILAVTVINVSNRGIATLDGIEYFTALTSLDCGGNNLTALDVSKNTALSVLHADGQTLEGVKLSRQGTSFTVDLSDYVSGDLGEVHTVICSDSYDSATGIAVFSFLPESVTYTYDTGFTNAQAKYMDVTLTPKNNPVITTSTLPDAQQGEAYTVTLAANGTTPISWDIMSGDLPEGLSLDNNAGVIAGVPEISGSFDFAVLAENANGFGMKSFTLTVTPSENEDNPVSFDDYDESVKRDIGINGLSVYPRFAMPRDATVDAQEAIYNAVSSQAQNFWESGLAGGISSRDAKTVFDSLKAELISKDIPQLLAVVMPVFTVSEDSWYMFKLPVDHIESKDTQIFFYEYGQSESDAPKFYTESGDSTEAVSGDNYINVAVYLAKGQYSPVLTVIATSNDVALVQANISSGSGGGSNPPTPVTPPTSPADPTDPTDPVNPGGGGGSTQSPDVEPSAPVSPDVNPESPDVKPESPDVRPESPDVRPESPDVEPVSPDVPAPDDNPESHTELILTRRFSVSYILRSVIMHKKIPPVLMGGKEVCSA